MKVTMYLTILSHSIKKLLGTVGGLLTWSYLTSQLIKCCYLANVTLSGNFNFLFLVLNRKPTHTFT